MPVLSSRTTPVHNNALSALCKRHLALGPLLLGRSGFPGSDKSSEFSSRQVCVSREIFEWQSPEKEIGRLAVVNLPCLGDPCKIGNMRPSCTIGGQGQAFSAPVAIPTSPFAPGSAKFCQGCRGMTLVCSAKRPRIKLIATDVDGTLLNSKQELTPAVQQAIRKAAEHGVPVCSTELRHLWQLHSRCRIYTDNSMLMQLVVATGKAPGCAWTGLLIPCFSPLIATASNSICYTLCFCHTYCIGTARLFRLLELPSFEHRPAPSVGIAC